MNREKINGYFAPEPPQSEPDEPTFRIDLSQQQTPSAPAQDVGDEPTCRIDVSAASQDPEDNSAPTRRIDLSASTPPAPVSPEEGTPPTKKEES